MAERLEDYGLSKKVDQDKNTLSLIGIIGCGENGQEIAKMVSGAGFEVNFVELSDELVTKALEGIGSKLDAEINSWGMTGGEKRLILSRIKGSTNLESLKDCDLIIEAITVEDPSLKISSRNEIFRKLEDIIKPTTTIATKTSTLLISDLAINMKKPERLIGLHFIEPSPAVNVVEVVKSVKTSDKTFETISVFVKMLKKQLVLINESPGNISTRIIVPLINEACELLMEGVGSVEDIDRIMRCGFGLEIGPFQLADKIGLDRVLRWMENLYNEFGERKYKPSQLIKRLVRSNRTGKRTGEGFYKYN
ncbi:MAG: 3-hydroxyacyl-CoA dehydrogenase family protein [Candidatus Delongbacteria bacterium]|nr:3-hydroxyacyl-CoA dehydrogenase family protein [Candidatus Delongbacteria bacterium]MBN2834194.1 3-hydroxyacyl-CoA dehydrogenase family protein [Candidatus Delongbacteria bacterium]